MPMMSETSVSYRIAQHADDVDRLPPGVPTVGSLGHASGDCQPCHFVHTRIGCKYLAACEYCHLEHPRKKRERPSRLQRRQCQSLADQVVASLAQRGGPTFTLEECEGAVLGSPELAEASWVRRRCAQQAVAQAYRRAGLEGE